MPQEAYLFEMRAYFLSYVLAVVTVNDYLAQRDAEWMGCVHRFLGLSVGLIQVFLLFIYLVTFFSEFKNEVVFYFEGINYFWFFKRVSYFLGPLIFNIIRCFALSEWHEI